MIARELFSTSPGMELLFDEKCTNFAGRILFHMVDF